MKLIFYSLLLLLVGGTITNNKSILKGKLSESRGNEMIYLLQIQTPKDFYNGANHLVVDSAVIDKTGYFEFPSFYKLDARFVYRLNLSSNQNPGQIVRDYIANNYLFVVNEDENIEIITSGNSFTENSIVRTNGKLTKQFDKLMKYEVPLYTLTDSFFVKINQLQGNTLVINKEKENFLMEGMSILKNEIYPNYYNMLNDTVDVRVGSYILAQLEELNKIEDNIGFYTDEVTKFKSGNNHPYRLWWNNRINDIKGSLKLNDKAYPITGLTMNDKVVDLYQVEGELILLDFWASWCSPCRIENRETVKPLYEEFKEKGFNVYSFSVDKSKAKWVDASLKDSINWFNVSDFKGKESSIWKRYNLTALPTTYLLDKEHKVLAKNIRGNELRKFVEAFFVSKKNKE